MQTFTGNVQTPLDQDLRTALLSLFQMLWSTQQPEVWKDDWDEFQRLCKPTSPDFILDIPDYDAFSTYTMFRGRLAA